MIRIKFELFGLGMIGNVLSFIFKPWIISISNISICEILEDFHLFMPNYLFSNLIKLRMYLDLFNWNQLEEVRVIKDMPRDIFENCGINNKDVPDHFSTQRMKISRIDNINVSSI